MPELKNGLQCTGFEHTAIERLFEQLDVDHDGQVCCGLAWVAVQHTEAAGDAGGVCGPVRALSGYWAGDA